MQFLLRSLVWLTLSTLLLGDLRTSIEVSAGRDATSAASTATAPASIVERTSRAQGTAFFRRHAEPSCAGDVVLGWSGHPGELVADTGGRIDPLATVSADRLVREPRNAIHLRI